MRAIALRAHFDGEHIQLDEPCELAPETPLMVIVRPEGQNERDEWGMAAGILLESAYGAEEPEYPLDLIKEPNPDYEGR